MRKFSHEDALELTNANIQAQMPYKEMLHAIIFDNGKELAHHRFVAKALLNISKGP
jgi:hypothetical protein